MTQGLLVITDDNNNVLYKVVAGSNGYNIETLKKLVSENINCLSAERLFELSKKAVFGSYNDLVISSAANKHLHKGSDVIDEKSLYVTKFHEPNFNPRWIHGTSEYYECIKI